MSDSDPSPSFFGVLCSLVSATKRDGYIQHWLFSSPLEGFTIVSQFALTVTVSAIGIIHFCTFNVKSTLPMADWCNDIRFWCSPSTICHNQIWYDIDLI